MLAAGAGICIGAWIKLFAVNLSFGWVLVGQAIEASAQVLTFSLAGSVTATWFGPKEIAVAGSLALFGDQVMTSLLLNTDSLCVALKAEQFRLNLCFE